MDNTEIDRICGTLRKCDRWIDDKTTYCVCCEKWYDKYYYHHTHKQTRVHTRNHVDLIKYLCNTGDDRVADVILYIVDNN
jgi:hypothetical protein